MNTHTPGPWQPKGCTVYADDNGYLEVAHCQPFPGRNLEQCQANARLIAAAPELLSALKECERIIGDYCSAQNTDPLLNARHAIAKAEGRA